MTAVEIISILGAAPAPATPQQLEHAEAELGFRFPEPLREILLLSDGVEGFLAEGSAYLALYPIDHILRVNRAHAEFKPRRELIGFGGDGGGEGYFFDYSEPGPAVFMIAWISDWKKDAIRYASGFAEFIDKVKAGCFR